MIQRLTSAKPCPGMRRLCPIICNISKWNLKVAQLVLHASEQYDPAENGKEAEWLTQRAGLEIICGATPIPTYTPKYLRYGSQIS